MPRFSENFSVSRGDLIYGVARSRKYYLRDLLGLDDKSSALPYVTIDQYNEHVPSLPEGEDKPVSQFPFKNHRALLEAHQKYSPLSLSPTVPKGELSSSQRTEIAKHRARLVREEDANPGDPESIFHSVPREKLAFRRASKFGIDYVIRNTSAWIHFVLDHVKSGTLPDSAGSWGVLAMENMMPKRGAPTAPKGFITGSELRYVFRHWSWIEPTGRLHFYLKGDEVAPPWELPQWTDLWTEYAQYRQENHDRKAFGRV